MNEAFGSINEYKREVSDLTPQYKAATDEIKDLVARVEDQKEQYIAVCTYYILFKPQLCNISSCIGMNWLYLEYCGIIIIH